MHEVAVDIKRGLYLFLIYDTIDFGVPYAFEKGKRD